MTRFERIEALLADWAGRGEVAGMTVAAVMPDGEVLTAAAGMRDVSSGTAMEVDTVVWIASMTKAITAAAAMQLVEQGKLTLDGPIADVLPELGSLDVLEGFGPDGTPRLRPARGAVTLRQLLTHSSGFVYDMWNADIDRYMKATGTPGIISCTEKALRLPLVFDPGTAWDYGIGIDWAGRAVEAASGMRLRDSMQAHLLGPLGMVDTGFAVGAAQRERLAKIHVRGPSGLVATKIAVNPQPEFDMGGGGLYGTVGDYLRFMRMILGRGALDGVRVLREDTVAMMTRNAMGDLRCRAMKSALPGSSTDVDFVDGMEWGLSFMINPSPLPTGRSAGSLAWAGLANSYYWIDPKRNIAGVYATQLLPFNDAAAIAQFTEFEAAVYALA